MNKVSRRALAQYAADQLLAGKSVPILAKQLAAILADSGRSTDGELLMNDISWELEQRQVLTVGRVTSTVPLSKQLEVGLVAQLKKVTKSQAVILESVLDASVIGGIKIETSGHVWDQTISRTLTELKGSF